MKKISDIEINAYHARIGVTVEERKARRLAEGWKLEDIEAEMNSAIMMSQIFEKYEAINQEDQVNQQVSKIELREKLLARADSPKDESQREEISIQDALEILDLKDQYWHFGKIEVGYMLPSDKIKYSLIKGIKIEKGEIRYAETENDGRIAGKYIKSLITVWPSKNNLQTREKIQRCLQNMTWSLPQKRS